MDESKLMTLEDRLNHLSKLPTTKDKQEFFLKDTIQSFTSETRCVNDQGKCVYYHSEKGGCSIGRWIENKEKCKEWDEYSMAVSRIKPNDLPWELFDIPQKFLYDVQALHDEPSCWDMTGMSKIGKKHVELICND